MPAPKLLFASPNGQSSVRVVFDQPMREGGSTDPVHVSNWSAGGGLPSVQSVLRTSNVELELVLVSPAPVAGGYSVSIASTVTSASGLEMDPAALSSPVFAVTHSDLLISGTAWSNPTTFDITFSEPISQVSFTDFADVLTFRAQDYLADEPSVTGVSQSGATLTLTVDRPGTSGALYEVLLNRDLFTSLATSTQLLVGQDRLSAYGQGNKPTLASVTILEDQFSATSSEVFGTPNTPHGWPLSHAFYAVDNGSLAPSVPLALGASESILEAPGASFAGLASSNVTFSIQTSERLVPTGQSFTQTADSVIGDGNEVVGATTVLNKVPGGPYELVFSSLGSVKAKSGRNLTTAMSITFTPSTNEFPLLAVAYLSTQVSAVIKKTSDNLAAVYIYKGSKQVSGPSRKFDPSVSFSLSVLDAVDEGGWLSVSVDGEVVLGASSATLTDTIIESHNIGQNAIALVLGSPTSTTESFSIDFTASISSKSYLGTGFLGVDSRDLLDFNNRSLTVVVGAASVTPPTPGYQGTGKAAFGISAIYFESRDAIQVTVAVSDAMLGRAFTGSATLLTVDGNPVDQALFDSSYLLLSYNEILVIFVHPKVRTPSRVSVATNIDGVDYSAEAIVVCEGGAAVNASLAQQPPSWFHRPLSNAVDNITNGKFGPAAIIH